MTLSSMSRRLYRFWCVSLTSRLFMHEYFIIEKNKVNKIKMWRKKNWKQSIRISIDERKKNYMESM